MAQYLFYPSADKQQDEIWIYTCDQWGEVQAEKYLKGLHKYIKKVAERKILWRALPKNVVNPVGIKYKAYFARYERHYIFFRELSRNSIGIMSILHEAMDLPARLLKDLRLIEEGPTKI